MSICILAAVVFGIMGIFSTKYRKLAKEAFSCVGKKIVFRPCKSSFNQQIKSKIIGKSLKIHPRVAQFIYKNFEFLSFIFTLIFFLSLIFTVIGVYNIIVFGTCDPVNPSQCFITSIESCGG